MKWFLMVVSLFVAAHVGARDAAATEFPVRPIRFVVPFTPGTGMDRIARLVAEDLKSQWGQAVVVENRTGAAGHVGAQAVAKASADGYSVLVTGSNISITATLLKSANFDALAELRPLVIAAYGDSSLVVGRQSKFNSLAEVVSHAKAAPGALRFATPGTGSPMHIGMAEFEDAAHIKFLHIPYKGTAPAITDLVGGHVDMMFVATHTVMPYVASGQLKVIAVAASKRNPLINSVPSFSEAGIPGVSTEAWYGFMLPKDVPADVSKKLYDGIVAALARPAIKSDLQKFGLDVRPSMPLEMDSVIRGESQRYSEVIKRHKITND